MIVNLKQYGIISEVATVTRDGVIAGVFTDQDTAERFSCQYVSGVKETTLSWYSADEAIKLLGKDWNKASTKEQMDILCVVDTIKNRQDNISHGYF